MTKFAHNIQTSKSPHKHKHTNEQYFPIKNKTNEFALAEAFKHKLKGV